MSKQDQPDLTPNMQELMAQMARMQTELTSLKERAQALPQLEKPAVPVPAITSTRRKTLKRLGLALLGGAVAATTQGVPTTQAKIVANPTLSGSTSKAGVIITPPGAAAPTGTAPNGVSYGLVASGDTASLNLANLPTNYSGVVGSSSGIGVYGSGDGGVYGSGITYGVYGSGTSGVYGTGDPIGVYGTSNTGWGIYGIANNSSGVYGSGVYGVWGYGTTGVYGQGSNYGVSGAGVSYGVIGNGNKVGVIANGHSFLNNSLKSNVVIGNIALSDLTLDLSSFSDNFRIGLYANAGNPGGVTVRAAVLAGNVDVYGSLTKGGGSFKIDHPLDPANKYLYHSFVESPDMMNIYNGNVTLDGHGEATIEMPDWFEVLNSDFRYQLTALDSTSPNLHIAERLKDRKFKIAGGHPGQEISWMVTGIRQDAWAKANRIQVEEDKKPEVKGKYLHPELFG